MSPTITSRFRPNHTGNHGLLPRAVGMCRWCWRKIWADCGNARGLLHAAGDGGECETCHGWMKAHPGQDPRDRPGVAERLPAERAETDDEWRDAAACDGLPLDAFAPDPDDDDPQPADPDAVWAARRAAAADACSVCPVLEQCRAAADAHGYEGVWGGRFYTRYTWTDLDTGEVDDTRFATKHHRRRRQERLRAAERAADRAGAA